MEHEQHLGVSTENPILDATADRQKTLLLPPVLGIAAVAGGVALLVAGVRKRT